MIADATPMSADVSREELDVISGKVIGAAQRVSSGLGWGFLEKVYENALVVELLKLGLRVERQPAVHVRYEGFVVGDFYPDLVVEDALIVEIKAVSGLLPEHRQQCLNYLRATTKRVCLLLNFGRPRLELKRLVWPF